MDVRSYWLMLPAEIQEYILIFKISQDVVEERKRQQRKRICNEVRQYHKLKEAWGLGPICCQVLKCKQCTERALGKIPPQYKFCNMYCTLKFMVCTLT